MTAISKTDDTTKGLQDRSHLHVSHDPLTLEACDLPVDQRCESFESWGMAGNQGVHLLWSLHLILAVWLLKTQFSELSDWVF
jgi:hypothetical protein